MDHSGAVTLTVVIPAAASALSSLIAVGLVLPRRTDAASGWRTGACWLGLVGILDAVVMLPRVGEWDLV